MKRRNFIKNSLGAALGLTVLPSVVQAAIIDLNQQSFSSDEMHAALHNYYGKIFNSKLDPTISSPNDRYYFAESFEVVVNKEKNSVFDIADRVIEICEEINFDASSLKKGIIPEGMTVAEGGIRLKVDGKEILGRVSELKSYDATIRTKNHISIISKSKPEEWSKLKKLKKGKHFYEGILNGSPFRVFVQEEHNVMVGVDQLYPNLRIRNIKQFNTLNIEQFKGVVSENIISKIHL
ncbi:hypothetical protein L3073_02820 [Ancylomarina sp. DW003]|nr:hypothetical protein [Ancylomarina sp. DW003]MDE5421135.1 hypothetical protein [Ancylomarina sp. DW003]